MSKPTPHLFSLSVRGFQREITRAEAVAIIRDSRKHGNYGKSDHYLRLSHLFCLGSLTLGLR